VAPELKPTITCAAGAGQKDQKVASAIGCYSDSPAWKAGPLSGLMGLAHDVIRATAGALPISIVEYWKNLPDIVGGLEIAAVVGDEPIPILRGQPHP
jgi:hypothetical protein